MTELYDYKGRLLLSESFSFTEDYAIAYDCEDCKAHVEHPEDDVDKCEECGSADIVFETSNEGLECHSCKQEFEPWTDVYIYDKNGDIRMCDDCLSNLPDKDEREGFILVHFNGFLKPTQISDFIFRHRNVENAIKEAKLSDEQFNVHNTMLLSELEFKNDLVDTVRKYSTDEIIDADNSFELLKEAIFK